MNLYQLCRTIKEHRSHRLFESRKATPPELSRPKWSFLASQELQQRCYCQVRVGKKTNNASNIATKKMPRHPASGSTPAATPRRIPVCAILKSTSNPYCRARRGPAGQDCLPASHKKTSNQGRTHLHRPCRCLPQNQSCPKRHRERGNPVKSAIASIIGPSRCLRVSLQTPFYIAEDERAPFSCPRISPKVLTLQG